MSAICTVAFFLYQSPRIPEGFEKDRYAAHTRTNYRAGLQRSIAFKNNERERRNSEQGRAAHAQPGDHTGIGSSTSHGLPFYLRIIHLPNDNRNGAAVSRP